LDITPNAVGACAEGRIPGSEYLRAGGTCGDGVVGLSVRAAQRTKPERGVVSFAVVADPRYGELLIPEVNQREAAKT
jgi:hypothetical protein